jgi:hypothetical protein
MATDNPKSVLMKKSMIATSLLTLALPEASAFFAEENLMLVLREQKASVKASMSSLYRLLFGSFQPKPIEQNELPVTDPSYFSSYE